jgi:hypothetical protein
MRDLSELLAEHRWLAELATESIATAPIQRVGDIADARDELSRMKPTTILALIAVAEAAQEPVYPNDLEAMDTQLYRWQLNLAATLAHLREVMSK